MDNEVWKEIKDTNGRYFISNMGRLKYFWFGREKITSGSKDVFGYLRFRINGKTIKAHRIVCEYFLEDFDSSLTVNHKNFDKSNNCIDNLELLTVRDNNIHYVVNKKKGTSSSKTLGVGFHRGINRWTARVNYNGERVSVGSYLTEKEAQDAVLNFNGEGIRIGKGWSCLGKRKYSNEFMMNALEDSKVIGIRRASKKHGLGSTTLSTYKREYLKNTN